MRLRNWTSAPLLPPEESFEMLREVVAVVDPATPVAARSRPLFASSHLRCQRGGRAHTGEDCLACKRLVSIRPSRGHRTVTVRCLWTDQDLVHGIMTHVERVPRVDRSATLGEAAAIVRLEDVHHLLVTERNDVVGTICACALVGEDGTVGARMIPNVWTIPSTATLGQVAEAMYDLDVGLLVVADRGFVLGTVAASDLHLDDAHHAH
jgi:CBS domain-containing protein